MHTIAHERETTLAPEARRLHLTGPEPAPKPPPKEAGQRPLGAELAEHALTAPNEDEAQGFPGHIAAARRLHETWQKGTQHVLLEHLNVRSLHWQGAHAPQKTIINVTQEIINVTTIK